MNDLGMPEEPTLDWAMDLPLEEVMKLPLDLGKPAWWAAVLEGNAETPDWLQIPSLAGQHKELALVAPNGPFPAMEEVATDPGDHVVLNVVGRKWRRRLRLVKMGTAPRARFYQDQVLARPYARDLQAWGWTANGGGQVVHYLELNWIEE